MSNFTGGNPARGTNKSHRNAMFRNPASFNNAVLPHGALAFLVCAGNMRGALHDGKTCGGVAHFPLFAPGTNFDPLYALLDAADDGDDGNAAGSRSDPLQVWTLFSKFPIAHPDAATYGNTFGFIGGLTAGAGATNVHPSGAEAGNSINGWNVFAVCSAVQPANDANDHYWVQGVPSSLSGSLTYASGPAADPSC